MIQCNFFNIFLCAILVNENAVMLDVVFNKIKLFNTIIFISKLKTFSIGSPVSASQPLASTGTGQNKNFNIYTNIQKCFIYSGKVHASGL